MTGVDDPPTHRQPPAAPAAAAACRGVDPEVFFGPVDSPQGGPMAGWELAALAVCQRCPLSQQCLHAALEFPAAEQHGVIGAMTAGQRRQVLRLSRRRPTRSYLAAMIGLAVRTALPPEVDELVVARLMAGARVTKPRRAEVAHAAVELARAGYTPGQIAARLGEHDRQVHRWLDRDRAGQPLTRATPQPRPRHTTPHPPTRGPGGQPAPRHPYRPAADRHPGLVGPNRQERAHRGRGPVIPTP
ncbi:MAG: WhiB family transcriptional regulator [Thermoleophilaceae bacterium]